MADINVWVVVIFSTLFIVGAYSPLWTKEEKTLLLSDEDLLLLFEDNTPLTSSEIIPKIDALYSITPSYVELAARLGVMVENKQLRKSEAVGERKGDFDELENTFDRKIVFYSRVFE